MCGIFGYIGRPRPPGELEAAARTLAHRGPDGFGQYSDAGGQVYLGHTRLAILDLSDRSAQPMSSPDGRYYLVFNGELCNFRELRGPLEQAGWRFATSGDTEVLLAAWATWGRECLPKLSGMFAFAVWDAVDRRLTLVRDRLGIKPLYVDRRAGLFAFASEAKALLALPGSRREIHGPALAGFLRTSYVAGRPSIWEGIERLRPGEWLERSLDTGAEQTGRYWSLEPRQHDWTAEQAETELEALLDTITRQELVADVPVGVLLSGGLDSGLVASAAARADSRLQSFSIGFDGWSGSEVDDARRTAERLGLSNTAYSVGPADQPRIASVLECFDEPLADNAVVPTEAVCRLARKDVTVALSGDGGDELFGGYTWYGHLRRRPVRRKAAFLFETLRRKLGWGRPWPAACTSYSEYHGFLTCPSFDREGIRRLFPWLREDIPETATPHDHSLAGWRKFDVNGYLVDNNLARLDTLSMAHGLEVRVPLLDHRLVEFAFSLPDALCLAGSETKVLLRRLASRRLPARVAEKPKQGFSFPLAAVWPLAAMAECVRQGNLVRDGVLCGRAFGRLAEQSGQGHWPNQVWILAALETWYSRWIVRSLPVKNESELEPVA